MSIHGFSRLMNHIYMLMLCTYANSNAQMHMYQSKYVHVYTVKSVASKDLCYKHCGLVCPGGGEGEWGRVGVSVVDALQGEFSLPRSQEVSKASFISLSTYSTI